MSTGIEPRHSYDALDRLTQASGPYATQGFSYDANGNRLREQSGSSVTTYAYAPGSQRLSSRSGSVNETRSYDAAGHPASVRGLPTTYSVSGRLAQAGSTEYRYDGFGQRVYKNVGGVITRYVYDAAGHLLAEADASGRTTREYVWLDAQPIVVLTPTTPGGATVRIDYIVPDHLGTPRLIIDSAGAVLWRWDSDPFGNSAPNEDPAGTGTRYVFNLRFPGQYFDAETGLSYNYMRMYEPGTGRYLESDPVGLAGGVNTYAYVGNNPLARTDPTGEFWWFALAGIGGAATEGVAAGGVSWGTTALAGLGLGAMMAVSGDSTESQSREMPPPIVFPDDCDDLCRKRIVDASNAYWRLTTKRMPQYKTGGTRGRDPGHAKAIKELQVALQKAINRVKLHCKVLPVQLPEWERAANEPLPE